MLLEWSVLMAMPCMVVRKEVLVAAGGFDETMTWAEDMDLWRRIAKIAAVAHVDEALVKVRVHEASTTFGKSGGVGGFKRYLDKAFAEDRYLGKTFKRRAYGMMYAKLAENLLGEGDAAQMKEARRLCGLALASWPLQFSALATLGASMLPLGWRRFLVKRIRRKRYPTPGTESL
jgi:hypothetical protein